MNNNTNRRTIFISGPLSSKITEYTYPSGKKGFNIANVWLTPEGTADSAGLISCRKQCFVDDGNCLGQQWRVKFPNPALPNGSTLTRKVGFSFQFEKNESHFCISFNIIVTCFSCRQSNLSGFHIDR